MSLSREYIEVDKRYRSLFSIKNHLQLPHSSCLYRSWKAASG